MKFTLLTILIAVSTYCYAQLPTYAPTLDLLAFYSFSGNILDNSGNGHNNANYNTLLTTDRFNTPMRALRYTGTGSEYLNYGDVDDFEGLIQLSFSFWILPEDLGQQQSAGVRPIISKWSSEQDVQNSSYSIFMDGSDLNFVLSDGFTSDTIVASVSNLLLNQWSHVVITFNYGLVKIYINNSLITNSNSSISQIPDSDRDFKIGDWYNSDNSNYATFIGKIDDVGLWSRELDLCEIDALYTGNDCPTAGFIHQELQSSIKLIRIVDLLGRETQCWPNTPLIYQFDNGTSQKVFIVE